MIGLLALNGCFTLLPSNGGGEVRVGPARARELVAEDVVVPDGFRVEPVVGGLTFPTAVALDDDGRVYVLESGYSYGEVFTTPRIARVERDGSLVTVVSGDHPPWTGFVWHEGHFYVAQGGEVGGGGRVVRYGLDGGSDVLVDRLPSGDHHTNGPVVHDGWVYIGQGTRTNSGVVGPDNADFGWLRRHPDQHDIPCADVELSGADYRSRDVLIGRGWVHTGAYRPFGTSTKKGEVVRGEPRCNGAVLRVPIDGGEPEVVAWGFRNPFGLALSGHGELYLTENGFDRRGTRPIYGGADYLWKVEPGAWYGWPDYTGGQRVSQAEFRPPGDRVPRRVLARDPSPPPTPVAVFAGHSSANGLDFARSAAFGGPQFAYVAEFGDMAPAVGKVLHPSGYRVVRVNVETGRVETFAANTGRVVGPASFLGTGGLERPVAVRFSEDGQELYVVDFGILTTNGGNIRPREGTGALWRIRSTGQEVAQP